MLSLVRRLCPKYSAEHNSNIVRASILDIINIYALASFVTAVEHFYPFLSMIDISQI